jgi:hypothetical protein
MSTNAKYRFLTKEFPNNASGQRRKLEVISKLEGEGWELVEERVQPAQFEGGSACCLFLICMPLAFFAYKNGKIVVSFRKER